MTPLKGVTCLPSWAIMAYSMTIVKSLLLNNPLTLILKLDKKHGIVLLEFGIPFSSTS
jgi:hypothetical protein